MHNTAMLTTFNLTLSCMLFTSSTLMIRRIEQQATGLKTGVKFAQLRTVFSIHRRLLPASPLRFFYLLTISTGALLFAFGILHLT